MAEGGLPSEGMDSDPVVRYMREAAYYGHGAANVVNQTKQRFRQRYAPLLERQRKQAMQRNWWADQASRASADWAQSNPLSGGLSSLYDPSAAGSAAWMHTGGQMNARAQGLQRGQAAGLQAMGGYADLQIRAMAGRDQAAAAESDLYSGLKNLSTQASSRNWARVGSAIGDVARYYHRRRLENAENDAGDGD